MKSMRALFYLLLVAALLTTSAPLLMAQTASTGALAGTVTDPSGAVISGATVTATNVGTGQSRDTSTSSDGAYKFSLLSPGNYSVKIAAAGFKTAEVPSIKVNVTETAVLNHSLEIGAQTQQVTVEAAAVTVQTENATNGGLVSGAEVTSLPLVSRNYTQIISLSPGVVANVTSASAVGNGTMDVAANGARQNQNNYSMDGSSIVNYLSGTGAQTGSFPGIAIPNPDTIQEFKVQTSQYDASSGRNSGANVDVVTKTGTNEFHGDAWEFNRNNFFNANDYFYKHSELSPGGSGKNKPQTLKQNTFGFTLGGPIKKDKLFFFGSYQGLRQVNGMGTSGFASGYTPNTLLMPWDDPNSPSDPRHLADPAAYKAYLGSVFGNGRNTGFPKLFGGTGVTIAPDGSNISNTAVALLQAKGVVKGGYNNGFYFPSAPANCAWVIAGRPDSGCRVAISDPIRASENQYMINSSYVLSSKHTLEERYMYQSDPQLQPFGCFWSAGNCNPGAPVNANYFNHIGQLKLNSVLTGNFVNEARFSFHRDVENNTDPTTLQACSLGSTANIIPLVNNGSPCGSTLTPPNDLIAARFPEASLAPILDIWGFSGASGAWSQGGNFSMISSNFNNTFQWADQISWTHGKQTIRAGFEAERLQHNGTIPASSRGELIFWGTPDFLTSSVGPLGNIYDPGYDDGTAAPQTGGIGIGFGLKGWLTHYNRVNAFTAYVQDDFKVNPKLTLNLGVRWEYNGLPDDVSGRFSNTWKTELEKVNSGSWFLAHPEGTLVGFVVPSNYDKTPGLTAPSGASGVVVNSNKTLVPGTPLHNFAPRLGLAWQPLGSKFVVRAGYGWFYDRIYGVLLIDNQLNLPPYSGAAAGPSPANQANTLHDPWYAGAGPLVWTPRYIQCPGPCNNGSSSGLGYTSDGPGLADRAPLTQQYDLDLQYEIARGWVADVGYIGSHGIHLYNWSQPINVAHLVANAPNSPTHPQDVAMIRSSLPFNDPANTSKAVGTNEATTFGNANLRVSYLGFTPGGVGETNTTGDMLYNSLQAQLRHQFGHGLFLQVSYTWSKEFTNVDQSQAGSGITPPGTVLYGISNSNDPLNLRQQYGLAAVNRPQRAVITYSYDLPYKHVEGVTGHVLGGWTISGVTTIQNGQPFTITDSGGGSIYGAGVSRAALADPVNCNSVSGNCQSGVPIASSGGKSQRVDPNNPAANWLNTSAFIQLCTTASATCTTPLPASSPYCIGGVDNTETGNPNAPCGASPSIFFPPGPPFYGEGATFIRAGTGWGNAGRSIVTGPGQFNFDMALAKSTKIWEHGTLQFRIEGFNIWNHAQFNPPPGINVSGSQFGKIVSTSVTPRVFQFGLKYLF